MKCSTSDSAILARYIVQSHEHLQGSVVEQEAASTRIKGWDSGSGKLASMQKLCFVASELAFKHCGLLLALLTTVHVTSFGDNCAARSSQ